MAESLVALRDRRQQVIARLSESYALDLFDVDELDRRLDLAHGARTVADLDALVADLAAPAPATTALVPVGPTAIDDPDRAENKKLRVIMGNLEIILPPQLAVDVDVSSFMGAVEERHRVPPEHDPSRPMLRIVGSVRLGNLEISTRLPGESRRDATKRERRERKQLREAQKALPDGGSKET